MILIVSCLLYIYVYFVNLQIYLFVLQLVIVHDPLNESEKSFIIKWVENNQLSSNGKIRWKVLIKEIKYVFGKLRSENQVKNYWYSKKRKSTNNINKSTKEKVFRSLKFKKRKQKEPLFSDYVCL